MPLRTASLFTLWYAQLSGHSSDGLTEILHGEEIVDPNRWTFVFSELEVEV